MENALDNYHQLVARVDALCAAVHDRLGERLTCHAGCSDCCTSITIFPVEAAALRQALMELPPDEQTTIRSLVAGQTGGDRCPLLHDQQCLLYQARPIICRTHGLPILFTEDDARRLDCCPLNLKGTESLSGQDVIDLDRLNSVLVAINALFLKQAGPAADLPQRLTISQAILSPR